MSLPSCDFSTSDQTAASIFYRAEAYLQQPIFRVIEYITRRGNPTTSHVFDNYESKTVEIAYRSFGPAALVGAAAYLCISPHWIPRALVAVVGVVFTFGVIPLAVHLLCYAFQKKNYIHLRTQVPEIPCNNPKIMTWNILGLPAGLNYTCGGQRPFRDRFPGIAEVIRRELPDTVIFQECMLDPLVTEMILQAFKDEYAHFFIHNGPNTFGIESGLLIMTKSSVYDYSFTLFEEGVSWKKMRGLSTLKIKMHPEDKHPTFAIISTHLEAGNDPKDREVRAAQLQQIHRFAQEQLPDVDFVVLAGDVNIDANGPEGKDLGRVLKGIHRDGEPTCTNLFNKLVYPEDKCPDYEWLDQIALILRNDDDAAKDVIQGLKVVPVFKNTEGNPDSSTSLSDHNPLIATLMLQDKSLRTPSR
ncbi:MAG: endonuclease/exonuclease/phosphatase family protein [Verrucomicrobia bacterium]|nr:endonuclease/exonuclease/phosphatase family protein [Verrucomicrobiota bacterium]